MNIGVIFGCIVILFQLFSAAMWWVADNKGLALGQEDIFWSKGMTASGCVYFIVLAVWRMCGII